MDWSTYLPSIVSLIGIPLAALLAWWQQRKLHDDQHKREADIRKEVQRREDVIRAEAQGREDRIRREQREREDAVRFRQDCVEAYQVLLKSGALFSELARTALLNIPGRRGFESFEHLDRVTTAVDALQDAVRAVNLLASDAVRDAATAYVNALFSPVEGGLPPEDTPAERSKELAGDYAALVKEREQIFIDAIRTEMGIEKAHSKR